MQISLHWLKINERNEYKFLSLTYKVLTTSQPDTTRSSSLVTLARPPVFSSLQITNHSTFTYASPYLCNQLLSSFRQPHSVHCPPVVHLILSISPYHSHHLRSYHLSQPLHFTPDTHLFHKSLLHSHSYSFRTDFYWIKGALVTARCTLVQSAVLWSHVVCLSVRPLVNC